MITPSAGAGTVVVSWLPCTYTDGPEGLRGHRTVSCLVCSTTWYNPPHDGRYWKPDAEVGPGELCADRSKQPDSILVSSPVEG